MPILLFACERQERASNGAFPAMVVEVDRWASGHLQHALGASEGVLMAEQAPLVRAVAGQGGRNCELHLLAEMLERGGGAYCRFI